MLEPRQLGKWGSRRKRNERMNDQTNFISKGSEIRRTNLSYIQGRDRQKIRIYTEENEERRRRRRIMERGAGR